MMMMWRGNCFPETGWSVTFGIFHTQSLCNNNNDDDDDGEISERRCGAYGIFQTQSLYNNNNNNNNKKKKKKKKNSGVLERGPFSNEL